MSMEIADLDNRTFYVRLIDSLKGDISVVEELVGRADFPFERGIIEESIRWGDEAKFAVIFVRHAENGGKRDDNPFFFREICKYGHIGMGNLIIGMSDFSDADFLAGAFEATRLGHLDMLQSVRQHKEFGQDEIHSLFSSAVSSNSIEIVAALAEEVHDPYVESQPKLLIDSVIDENDDIALFLLERFDFPSDSISYAAVEAAANKNEELIEAMLPKIDMSFIESHHADRGEEISFIETALFRNKGRPLSTGRRASSI